CFSRDFSETFKSLPSLRIIIKAKTNNTIMHRMMVPTIPGWVCHVLVSISDPCANDTIGNNNPPKKMQQLMILRFIPGDFSIRPFYLLLKVLTIFFPTKLFLKFSQKANL